MRALGHVRAIQAALVGAALLLAAPASARTEDPQAPPAAPKSSSVVVERVQNTAIFAPDFKYTNIDNVDGLLLGGYGGVLFDNKIFLGGGGYWMVNGDDLHELGYGGVIVEWHLVRSKTASVSVGGLVGGGVARVSYYDTVYPMPGPHYGHGGYSSGGYPHGGYWVYDQGFFVGEPQVTAVIRLGGGASFAATAGYRLAAFAEGAEDQIRGLTAGVSIRFGATR
jgi:hypothetical protein